MIGVYIIRHSSGLFYIGSTGNYTRRKIAHQSTLKSGRHANSKLQAAFNTCPGLTWELVPKGTIEEARQFERELLQANYMHPFIANYTVAQPFSPEHKQALCDAKTHSPLSEEHRNKISQARLGHRHTTETIEKMSKSRVGKPQSEEWADRRAESKRIGVTVNGVSYRSAVDAAAALSISRTTVLRNVRSQDPKHGEWQFTNKEPA